MIVKVLPMSIQNISCTCAIRTATRKSNKPQKNRAKARFFCILRTALDNSAQTVYNYDSTDLRSVTVTAVTADGVTTTYTYDANGNTLTAGDKTYTYNDRGQQTGYSNGTTAAAYAYNPSGLRNVKTVGGSTKYFVYNGMNIVYEYSESVADGVAYFYGLNRTHNSNGEIYVYNAHGDVVQLVKDNAVVASYTYDAFGNLTSQIGNSDNPFLYCGEYYDAETQTYYLRARYYNPANGRFTQQDAWSFMDTSDPLSLNLYTYCCNNPVLYVDPSGRLKTSQYLSFLREFFSAGAEITWNNMGGGIIETVSRIVNTASMLYQTMSDLLSGGLTLDDLIRAIGQNTWDSLSGDIRYVIENYKMFDSSLELTTEEIETLAKHTAGAYEEIVQVVFIIDGAVKAIKQMTAATINRANFDSISSLDDLVKNPSILEEVTPDQLYNYLLSNGYEVKPLTRSSTLSGMTFEQGGGFKVNWGGDRMLSYHPATGSHHGGAYYKISSGAEGIARVFLRGDS